MWISCLESVVLQERGREPECGCRRRNVWFEAGREQGMDAESAFEFEISRELGFEISRELGSTREGIRFDRLLSANPLKLDSIGSLVHGP